MASTNLDDALSGSDTAVALQALAEAAGRNGVQEDWAAHAFDHPSTITAEERVLPKVPALVAAVVDDQGCADDPMWRDADGDGCEIYRFAIESGKATREAACRGGGQAPVPEAMRLRGVRRVSVVSDATASLFCRATCGTCQN